MWAYVTWVKGGNILPLPPTSKALCMCAAHCLSCCPQEPEEAGGCATPYTTDKRVFEEAHKKKKRDRQGRTTPPLCRHKYAYLLLPLPLPLCIPLANEYNYEYQC